MTHPHIMDISKKKRSTSRISLQIILLSSFLTTVLSGSTGQGNCGRLVHTPVQGFIESPGFPDFYPNDTNCQWEIRGVSGSIISISFDDFDLDEVDDPNCHTLSSDRTTCCSSSWLKIGSLKDEDPVILCGRNKIPKPYLSVEPVVRVKFHSSSSAHKTRGFRLLYVVNQLPERQTPKCQLNETTCSSQPGGACVPRCDHIMHCSNGVDEMDCVKGCQGRIMCKSWNGCYTPSERCNGVAQCGDHSDEHECSPDLCRSYRGGFLCHNRQCIRESWQCDQTNDCGDGSDELNCLKNSVITAAVMGSLICGLLLVIAIGCTCKLYTLRYGDGSGGNSSVSRPSLQLSPLEREILCREPPPPYSIAVSHPPGVGYFQSVPPNQPPNLMDPLCLTRLCRGSHQRRTRRVRRQRRHPPASVTQPCLMVMPPDPTVRMDGNVYQPAVDNNNGGTRSTSNSHLPDCVYIPPRVSIECGAPIDNKVCSAPAAFSPGVDEASLLANVPPPSQVNLPYMSNVGGTDEAVPIVMRLDSRQQDDDDDRPLLEDE